MKLLIKTILLCCLFVLPGCKNSNSGTIVRGTSICGGTGNFPCPNNMYCELKENCGGYDGDGLCAPRPQSCLAEIKPICGCDNRTYSNKCAANAAGITLKHPGECKE